MRELLLVFLLAGFVYMVGPLIHKLNQAKLDPHEELVIQRGE